MAEVRKSPSEPREVIMLRGLALRLFVYVAICAKPL
jgi:hypothetical protein